MAGTKEIKRRIKSVKNTKKITKAMELVAASKMKRAVSSTLSSRLYAEYSWEILTSVSQNLEESTNPLFANREVKNILMVLITSNRGLCGAYNAQVIKKAIALLKIENKNINIDFVTIGKKGDMAMRRIGKNILANFTDLPDNISVADILPISKFITDEYNAMRYDKILVAYTDFISALTQKPNIKQVLPISKASLKEFIDTLGENLAEDLVEKERKNKDSQKKIDYLFEGDQEELITSLAEKLTRMQIYQMFLESNASEQSSRMMAMKNASEASGEMIDDLTLMFNKARQANITREISEISAGMASVS
jgi:F-type H+-transporting ATPase subunit gamma